MPLLLVMWCIPIDSVQSFAKGLMGKFVPLALLPIPAAITFRLAAEIIGGVERPGLLEFIFALILLGVAAILPKFMFGASSAVARSAFTASKTMGGMRGGAAGMAAGATAGNGIMRNVPGRGGGMPGSQATLEAGHDGGAEDATKHNPTLNFRDPQKHRAAKVGRKARNLASAGGSKAKSAAAAAGGIGGAAASAGADKTKDAAESAAGAAVKSKYESGNTFGNLASEATNAARSRASSIAQSAAESMDEKRDSAAASAKSRFQKARKAARSKPSKRRQKISNRIDNKRQQLKEDYAPNSGYGGVDGDFGMPEDESIWR